MKTLLLIGLIFVLFILLKLFLKYKKSVIKEDSIPYKKKKFFFTIHEKKYLPEVFKYAEEKQWVVFPKVRWTDFIEIDLYKKDKRWIYAWNKIKSKHVDFLFCDPSNYYEPVEVWEIDDWSHDRFDRIERDHFQNEILDKVGLNIVRK